MPLTNQTLLGQNEFYFAYDIPNFEQLLKDINSAELDSVDKGIIEGWNCDAKVLDPQKYATYLMPVLDQFCEDVGKQIKFDLSDGPWLNIYRIGNYQDVHHHVGFDIATVWFLNEGEDFSEFYFYNSNRCVLSQFWNNLLCENNIQEIHKPNFKPGTMILFPTNTLHGVSQHRSKVERKSIAWNIKVLETK